SETVAKDRAPVIEAACRRIGRSDLRESEGKDARDGAAERPAETDRPAAGAGRTLGERVDAARENADDREGDCKVREPAHAPLELLSVAHAVEDFQVLLFVGLCVSSCSFSHVATPRCALRRAWHDSYPSMVLAAQGHEKCAAGHT